MAGEIRIGGLRVDMRVGFAQLNRDLRQVNRELKKASRDFKRLGSDLTRNFTVPLAAVGAAAVAAADQFDKAFATIRRGTGATGSSLAGLQDDFRSVFSQVSESAGQVATAIADLNTRTGQAGQPLRDLTVLALELSRVTGTDVASNVRGLTRVFGDWQIATSDQTGTLDFLFKVSQQTGIGLDRLLTTIVNYGVPLRQLGFGFEEAAALIGKFEKEGVNTEAILGGLKQALGRTLKEGLDPAVEFRKLADAAKESGDSIGFLSRVVQFAGTRAGADLAAAFSEGRFEIEGFLGDLRGSNETIRTAAASSITFAESLARVRNALTIAFEPLGSAIIKEAVPLLEGIAEILRDIGEIFSELSPRTQRFIVTFGALAAILGPIAVGIGAVLATIVAISTVLGGPALAGLALYAAGFVTLGATLNTFREEVGTLISGPLEAIKNALSETGFFLQALGERFTTFGDDVSAVFGFLRPIVANFFQSIREFWSNAFAEIKEEVSILVGFIVMTLRNGITGLLEILSKIPGAENLFEGLKDSVDALSDGLAGAFDDGRAAVEGYRASLAPVSAELQAIRRRAAELQREAGFGQAISRLRAELDQLGTAQEKFRRLNAEIKKGEIPANRLRRIMAGLRAELRKTEQESKKTAKAIGGGPGGRDPNSLAGASKEFEKSLAKAKEQLEDLQRDIRTRDLKDALQDAADAGDQIKFDTLKKKLIEEARAGMIEGLEAGVADTETGRQLIELIGSEAAEAIDSTVGEQLKTAHIEAVDTWQEVFQTAIGKTGLQLDGIFGALGDEFGGKFIDILTSGIGELFGVSGSANQIGGFIKSVFGFGGAGAAQEGQAGGFDLSSTAANVATLGIAAGIEGGLAFFERIGDDQASRFKTGEQNVNEAVEAANLAAGASLGVGSLLNDVKNFFEDITGVTGGFADPIGTKFGFAQQAFGIFGTNDVQQAIRKGIQEAFTEALEQATGGAGLQLFAPGGGLAQLDVFNFIGGSDKFNQGGFEFIESLESEARGVFDALAVAFGRIFDIPEDFDRSQIAVLLSESLLGDIDNAKILVKSLGLDFETLKNTLLEAAQLGEISWGEFNIQIANLGAAFEPGLQGIGNVEKAIEAFIASGARGVAATEALKNAAFEFAEAGGTFEGFRDRLVAAGLSAEEAEIIMNSFAARGVDSLNAIINASDELLGAITGDIQNAGFQFAELSKEVLTVKDALDAINQTQLQDKELKINVVATGEVGLLEEAGGGEVTANVPVQEFQRGGIIRGATKFRFSGGLGVAGERGPEAILPLRKGIGGKLGVDVASGKGFGGMTLNIDARGADPGVEARIVDALSTIEENAIAGAVQAVAEAQERGRFSGVF
ncbi:MAG: phage tail tape measure protein [Candidatus Latescibacteria bacterium]|nr:phage tail tape measure protein [Candidatus Latescibacterota bacterium]NIO78061.1 phage tail tape measure protein [Candidatus Latescibacterota bacterium]